MSKIYNFYCDESCHLEEDGKRAMVLGAIVCPLHRAKKVNGLIRSLKIQHGFAPDFEVKWTKVSIHKIEFYKALVDLFFSESRLSFRGVVADKSNLDHKRYDQNHDDWYFKMYYVLLKHIIDTGNKYNIYLDVKDTRSTRKTNKLHEVLCNKFMDFECETIKGIRTVDSKQIPLVQMCDLFVGCLSFNANQPASTSEGKALLRSYFEERCGYSLGENTPYGAGKVNWLVWPKGRL